MPALDATATGVFSFGTSTHSHTVGAGSNRALFAGAITLGNTVTGATYGGVAMTRMGSALLMDPITPGTFYAHLFGLLAPASGAANVVISQSNGSADIYAESISYSDVYQGALPTPTTSQVTSASPITYTLTVGANSWLVALVNDDTSATATGGAGTTVQIRNFNWGGTFFADSNGALSAGSQSLVINPPATDAIATFYFELQTAAGGGGTGALSSAGVGAASFTGAKLQAATLSAVGQGAATFLTPTVAPNLDFYRRRRRGRR